VAPYILDPTARIFCANGKPDPAWDAISAVAVTFIRGRRDEEAWAVNAMLDQVVDEMNHRFLHDMTGSKVTEADGLPLTLVVIDELQNYTVNGTPTDETIRGRKATLGDLISHKLIDIVKNGRAAGYILALATQRPSDLSLPVELRSQIGTRFAVKVMDWQTSNMILGQNLSTQGYDASQIPSKYKGLGILVPDAEEETTGLDLDEFPRVRSYLCDDHDFEMLCARGRELRLEAGTLEGHAAGETDTDPADEIEDADVVASEIPEVLESIFDFVHGRDDKDRVAARDLRERFDPDSNDTKFGLQLRRWGCPSGRDGGRGPSGPRVGDIRVAVERMRAGGPIEVAR
jgi:S-DNA-T family DNA segregation ATPase FtsK/SpoIIIE